MSLYLGIDVGTSGTKAILCNEKGTIAASATAEHPCYFPQPRWSEQEPEDWWQSTVQSVQKAIEGSGAKPGEIQGIGLSGQMHGSVFLDKHGKVLGRALLWNDQRTSEECAEIESKAGGRANLIRMVSNPAFTGFTAPKILWVRRHQPAIYEQTARVLLPKDYIRYRLTGEYATEVSDASGTLLLDVTNRRWCEPLLSLLNIDKSLMPSCPESQEISGRVSSQVTDTLGLRDGTPVIGGGGDQAAGAIGNGIVQPGIISATMGTSGVVFAHADKVQTEPEGRVHTMCHAVKGAWHMMGVVLSAGGSLQWYRNQLGQKEVEESKKQDVDPYEMILQQAAAVPPGAEGLFFLPYLTGERHPHSDPFAKAAWIGLTVRHTQAHMARAVIEGATFAMRDCLEVIEGMGVPIKQIRLSGGGARSAFWRQLQADIYGYPVATINAQEGPAFGAALLAMVGTGAYASVPEACKAAIQITEDRDQDPSRRKRYDQLHKQYRRLYPALRQEFRNMGSNGIQ